jgi:hypothetical protein
MTIDCARLTVPAAWCRLAHCVAHKQFVDHALVYGNLPLRDLLDSALLARSENIDFEAIGLRFSSRGARIALAFHLAATQRLLGGKIAEQGLLPWVERMLFRRALFLVAHPRLAAWIKRLLRPWLLLRRSLSHAALRRRLLRNLLNPTWYSRQWYMVRQSHRLNE